MREHHGVDQAEPVGDAHRDVAGRQSKGGGDLAAVNLAARLKPPQRQQVAVGGVEPAGRGAGRAPKNVWE